MQPKPKQKKFGYKFSVGRRKSAVARVRFFKDGQGDIIINGKPIGEYFPYFQFQNIIKEPLKLTGKLTEGRYTIKVSGGGTRGQAESIRLGISRILLQIDKNSRPILKAQKLLTRDPRVVERKKYGLKKARRAPQWQKR
ncbi:MAG: 30S ribosomal protein S9 [Patescibacteria group bacterium]